MFKNNSIELIIVKPKFIEHIITEAQEVYFSNEILNTVFIEPQIIIGILKYFNFSFK